MTKKEELVRKAIQLANDDFEAGRRETRLEIKFTERDGKVTSEIFDPNYSGFKRINIGDNIENCCENILLGGLSGGLVSHFKNSVERFNLSKTE